MPKFTIERTFIESCEVEAESFEAANDMLAEIEANADDYEWNDVGGYEYSVFDDSP